ncbi:zinc finger protein SNAI3 [Osmerus eperlanus]|uniref:zinc finger protein SNAI3 n=1 Tax=Osmerus eperlanus TaxID=29151 RepID=UPI002E113E10
MPRSFLIKKYLTNKKPNYGELDSKTNGVQAILSLHELPCLIPNSPPHPQSGFPGLLSSCSCCSSCYIHPPVVASQPPRHSASSLGSPEQDSPLSPAPGSLSDSHSVVEPNGTTEPFKSLEHHNFLPPPQTLLAPCHPPTPSRRPSLPPGLAPGLGFLPGVGQERFECYDCHKAYFTFSGLAKHRQLHCDWQCHKYFSCKYCDKEYVSLGALKMHIRTHTLPCVCRLCGKAFSRPWLLQGHIRTHTGEKPFSCPHCSRAFADRSNLRAHLQTHSDVKKYQCSSCSKTFSRISLLARHQEAGCLLN